MGFLKPKFQKSAITAKENFRASLGAWFSSEGKDFPWRNTRDPYAILVSEVMLQQTQIATVLGKGYYVRFLEKFPDIRSLANAEDESLLKAWEGLGYYRRARMIRETARAILEIHGGVFPEKEAELLELPGIGHYTAAALRAFAFDRVSGLVDGNVSRVLSRLMDDYRCVDATITMRAQRLRAEKLCDPEHPRRHHYAMMELGQTICRPGIPHCEICPVSGFCKTRTPEKLPVKKPRTKTTEVSEYAIWARDDAGRVLLHHESGNRRNGLWKLPLRTPEQCSPLKHVTNETYAITRYKVRLAIYLSDPERESDMQSGDQWIAAGRLHDMPMAAPFRRVVERLLPDF
ncbi:MAG: A/G-specific adenine glycosylase [Armatimonadetes bacterium]|nr:A/G-specific adenine glycosylase [Akkermansiaceae bacterium]